MHKSYLNQFTTPWGPIGYIVYKRTYARRLREDKADSPTEEFTDTVYRIIEACRLQLKCGFTHEEEKELAELLLTLKGSVAGRFWWQLGTKTVDTLGLPSLQNCAVTLVNEPVRPFTWAMELLMLGCGVGYNIQKEYVYQIPKLTTGKKDIIRQDDSSADFIVPDTREGWVKLLGKVLKAHFYTGKGFTYSTQLIRSKGAPIKGFGGTASGPEILCKGIEDINKVLNKRSGKKLRPVDCLDVMNIIGSIVVAGNVRRSAQLALGDWDDLEFIKAKRWDLGTVPNWRAMSNNSIVAPENVKDLPQEFWDSYNEGEPIGLINLDLSRKCGRLGETQYTDPDVIGYNPCAEQSLNDKETCCLGEIYLPNLTSKEEFFKVISYIYKICKHSLALPSAIKETEAIVHKNMRMGIGVTGVLQASEEQKGWLNEGYQFLRNLDKEYSNLKGWPESVKLSTCKPSGTLSLLPDVTPGIHPAPAGPYYIRRMRISAESPLVEVCRKNGYFVEYARNYDGKNDMTTVVVEFPCKVPESTPIGDSLGAITHLELIKWLQTVWSDNSVSCTVYYRKEELPEIKRWLEENFSDSLKTVSFLLYYGHGFDQAPYETITKERYDELIKQVKPITSVNVEEDDMELQDCDNGACPIK
jgi:ribonucleoside-triphosphate reductase